MSRLLLSSQLKAVGPFVFFDHFGPLEVQLGANHDARPQPHIGSRRERIVRASRDWDAQKMGRIPGETEFIPLPERRFEPASEPDRAATRRR